MVTAAAPADEPPDELTPTEAAVLLSRGETAVRRLIGAGKLRATRRLGRIYVRRADVERLRRGEPVVPADAGGD